MKKLFLILLMVPFVFFIGCPTDPPGDDGTGDGDGETTISDAAEITGFVFAAAENAELTSDVTGNISGTDISITVPYDTDVTSLVPTISISEGAAVTPASGTARDFTTPVMYTVTAEDEVTDTVYLATVHVDDFQETDNDFSDSFVQQLEATDRAAGDYLGGFSGLENTGQAALSQDGTTMVIGAPYFGASADGAAVVFEYSGGSWQQAAVLTGSQASTSDRMGSSVDISMDGSVIAVGARSDESTDFTASGQVYLYVRDGLSWSDTAETTRLHQSDRMNSDRLGTSVAVSSDGSVVAAGAPWANAGGTDEGQVYIFLEPDNGWPDGSILEESAALSMSAAAEQSSSQLGFSLAISADGTLVAAGAPFFNAASNDDGAVFLFSEPAGGWDDNYPLTTSVNETAVLTAATPSDTDWLGYSVAVTDDGNTVAAGSINRDENGRTNNGAVFIYRNPGAWADSTEDELLTAYNGLGSDYFGFSVSLSASGGYLVTGAAYRNVADPNEGAAYLFKLDGGSYGPATPAWFSEDVLLSSDSYFGYSAAISPDAGTICITAPGWTDSDAGLSSVGTAFIYQ